VPILDPHHDLAHPVEEDTAWSESYYFNAYDAPSDSGFFTRIGIRPNEGTMDVGMSVWLPGDELAEYRAVTEQRTMIDSDLHVGDVHYQMLEPMKAWRITMRGEAGVRRCGSEGESHRVAPIDLDVTFSALTPGVGTDGQGGRQRSSEAAHLTANSVGKGHLEQSGRWSGTLSVDGTEHQWSDALGNRDRSWGPRRWGGPLMWRWFSINISDDIHFGGIRIGTEKGDLHRGWMWDGTEAVSIREWRVRTELDDDGLTHRVSHVVAVDKLGREHELRADLLRVAPGRGRSREGRVTVLNEGLARWTYGAQTGYGISEYLHQLGDDGRPIVAVE
jgi:hypothetical protein